MNFDVTPWVVTVEDMFEALTGHVLGVDRTGGHVLGGDTTGHVLGGDRKRYV